MDAGDLRVFEAVLRTGGINRAAGELNTVQSNVTARIRRLEAELGTRLFDRHARGVTPTAAGRRLAPFASAIDGLLQEARRAVADDGVPRGALTIGALETTAALRLAPALADYAAAWPEVDLVLRTGTSAEMLQAVLDRDVEGAFVCGPVSHPDLVAQPMFREELVLATSPAIGGLDGLADRPDAKIVVLRAGCSYRQRLEEVLARRGVAGLRRLEFGTIEALLACTAAGIGVTLLPRGIVEAAAGRFRLSLCDLPPAEALVETLFVQRREAMRSSALSALLDRVAGKPRAAA
ncbi:LysR family transcriptional regulator [Marinibaculum pumilum]|uniref:LysR family transcriptional regulator n=1 Tax=Marinibaculum pumilum TaxID=1766165 RepID=A0ABV7L8N5_9PROT